jgi:hypothetical protein
MALSKSGKQSKTKIKNQKKRHPFPDLICRNGTDTVVLLRQTAVGSTHAELHATSVPEIIHQRNLL